MLYGRGGNDLIDGRGGTDILVGGSETDGVTYERANTAVKLTVEPRGTVVIDPGEDAPIVRDHISEFEIYFGSRFDDRLVGSKDSERLVGGKGEDTLKGLGEGDTLEGGDGDDTIFPGPGDDFVDGGPNDPSGPPAHPATSSHTSPTPLPKRPGARVPSTSRRTSRRSRSPGLRRRSALAWTPWSASRASAGRRPA